MSKSQYNLNCKYLINKIHVLGRYMKIIGNKHCFKWHKILASRKLRSRDVHAKSEQKSFFYDPRLVFPQPIRTRPQLLSMCKSDARGRWRQFFRLTIDPVKRNVWSGQMEIFFFLNVSHILSVGSKRLDAPYRISQFSCN